MTLDQHRARMKSAVWKAIAQSGVDVTALPSEQQAKIVDAVSDESLVVLNEILGTVYQKESVKPLLGGGESIVWEGRPFLSLIENYIKIGRASCRERGEISV